MSVPGKAVSSERRVEEQLLVTIASFLVSESGQSIGRRIDLWTTPDIKSPDSVAGKRS
jgi:hypothetical protein